MRNRILKHFRGGMFLCDFGEIDGSGTREIRKVRPCVIMSANSFNDGIILQVIPIISTCKEPYVFECVPVPSYDGKNECSYANVIQMRAVDRQFLGEYLGIMPEEEMKAIDNKILEVFGFEKVNKNTDFYDTKETKIEEKTDPEPKNKIVNHKFWDDNTKKQFLSDYDKLPVEKVIEKYGFSGKKSVQQKAYLLRKRMK